MCANPSRIHTRCNCLPVTHTVSLQVWQACVDEGGDVAAASERQEAIKKCAGVVGGAHSDIASTEEPVACTSLRPTYTYSTGNLQP